MYRHSISWYIWLRVAFVWTAASMTMPLMRRIAAWAVRLESWYFDKKHNVETQASSQEQLAGMADLSAGFWYLPTRPATVRRVLRELPLHKYSEYTFIDLGSGKGRVLLLAAQYGFRRVVGVEFRKELHDRAIQNARSCRRSKTRRSHIEFLNINARDYIFPDENLVLYFFNPFGQEIMGALLKRLEASIERCPRDVLVVMVYPEHASALETTPRLRLYKQFRPCRIYRSTTPT